MGWSFDTNASHHTSSVVSVGNVSVHMPVIRSLLRGFGSFVLIPALLCSSGCSVFEDLAGEKKGQKQKASDVTDVVFLEDKDLDESSGLASSLRRPGYFWTHNDSGGNASIYAYDKKGRRTGKVKLKKVDADDWEDCCTFMSNGQAKLLIADCGDNKKRRSEIKIYVMDEPDPRESESLKNFSRLTVRYPDGPRDCEAVAVDAVRKQIVLLTKSLLPLCEVYTLPLPDSDRDSGEKEVTARKIGTVALPLVTGADVDQVTGDLWVTTYFQAFQFRLSDRMQPLSEQIRKLPQAVDLPKWEQVEAVAVDSDQNVWITSEGSPTPLGRLVFE